MFAPNISYSSNTCFSTAIWKHEIVAYKMEFFNDYEVNEDNELSGYF